MIKILNFDQTIKEGRAGYYALRMLYDMYGEQVENLQKELQTLNARRAMAYEQLRKLQEAMAKIGRPLPPGSDAELNRIDAQIKDIISKISALEAQREKIRATGFEPKIEAVKAPVTPIKVVERAPVEVVPVPKVAAPLPTAPVSEVPVAPISRVPTAPVSEVPTAPVRERTMPTPTKIRALSDMEECLLNMQKGGGKLVLPDKVGVDIIPGPFTDLKPTGAVEVEPRDLAISSPGTIMVETA